MVWQLNSLGVPAGKKDETVQPPVTAFSEPDYWRGLVDADGSLGLTKSGQHYIPFISLITKSDNMAESFKNYVDTIIGYRPQTQRNARDNAYNIMACREDAQNLIASMYPGALFLRRKWIKAQEALSWTRPTSMKAIDYRFEWTEEAKEFAANHPIEITMETYGLSYDRVVNERKRMRAAGRSIPDGRTQTRLARQD